MPLALVFKDQGSGCGSAGAGGAEKHSGELGGQLGAAVGGSLLALRRG
jgi:hypothetical protein